MGNGTPKTEESDGTPPVENKTKVRLGPVTQQYLPAELLKTLNKFTDNQENFYRKSIENQSLMLTQPESLTETIKRVSSGLKLDALNTNFIPPSPIASLPSLTPIIHSIHAQAAPTPTTHPSTAPITPYVPTGTGGGTGGGTLWNMLPAPVQAVFTAIANGWRWLENNWRSIATAFGGIIGVGVAAVGKMGLDKAGQLIQLIPGMAKRNKEGEIIESGTKTLISSLWRIIKMPYDIAKKELFDPMLKVQKDAFDHVRLVRDELSAIRSTFSGISKHGFDMTDDTDPKTGKLKPRAVQENWFGAKNYVALWRNFLRDSVNSPFVRLWGKGTTGIVTMLKQFHTNMKNMGPYGEMFLKNMTKLSNVLNKTPRFEHAYIDNSKMHERIYALDKAVSTLGMTAEQVEFYAQDAVGNNEHMLTRLARTMSVISESNKKTGIDAKYLGTQFLSLRTNVADFGSMTDSSLMKVTERMVKMRLTTEELNSVFAKFTDFEGATTSAAKLSQAFGMQIDALKLIQAEDPTEIFDMFRESFEATGRTFESMNRHEMKLFTQATGMSAKTAKKIMELRELGEEDSAIDSLLGDDEPVDAAVKAIETLAEALGGLQGKNVFHDITKTMETMQKTMERSAAMGALPGQQTQGGKEMPVGAASIPAVRLPDNVMKSINAIPNITSRFNESIALFAQKFEPIAAYYAKFPEFAAAQAGDVNLVIANLLRNKDQADKYYQDRLTQGDKLAKSVRGDDEIEGDRKGIAFVLRENQKVVGEIWKKVRDSEGSVFGIGKLVTGLGLWAASVATKASAAVAPTVAKEGVSWFMALEKWKIPKSLEKFTKWLEKTYDISTAVIGTTLTEHINAIDPMINYFKTRLGSITGDWVNLYDAEEQDRDEAYSRDPSLTGDALEAAAEKLRIERERKKLEDMIKKYSGSASLELNLLDKQQRLAKGVTKKNEKKNVVVETTIELDRHTVFTFLANGLERHFTDSGANTVELADAGTRSAG